MTVLALIPARGGSKGVPGKNVRPLAGKSPIQWAQEAAAASGSVDRIVLSTDDESIAAAGRALGLDVPFLRPVPLAADDTPMIDVAIHALEALAHEGYAPDALLLLQPTSPLRTHDHIRRAIELLDGHDAVCSVVAVPREWCPHYVMRIRDDGFLDHFLPEGRSFTRRQDVPAAYRRDGTLYLTRADVILAERSFYGSSCVPLIVEPEASLSIDQPEEWLEAERRLLERTEAVPS